MVLEGRVRLCVRDGQGGVGDLRAGWRLDNGGVLCVDAWSGSVEITFTEED